MYLGMNLRPTGYIDLDLDSRKSTSGCMFTLNGRAIIWRSVKQSCIADSTIEAEYVAALKMSKDAKWPCNFLRDLKVFPTIEKLINLYCDNSSMVVNSKKLRSHQIGRHVKRKYRLI